MTNRRKLFAKVIEVFFEEVRKQYVDANTINVILDNARY